MNKEEEKYNWPEVKLKNLPVHEKVWLGPNGPSILRVPNGWIYEFSAGRGLETNTVFVPERE